MFYSRLTALCAEHGVKITNVVSELKMGSGNLSNWKAGRMPRGESLSKLADYFHVSTDYLLGRTDDPSPVGKEKEPTPVSEDGLTAEQADLVSLYKAAPPSLRAAALAVLKSAEGRDKSPGAVSADE